MSRLLREYHFPRGQRLALLQGDLTLEAVDAIVNAANSRLAHGGGVAGAIAYKGGPQIQQESDAWVRQHGPVSHTEPAYTSAGKLPARYVIHAVGPVWGSGKEDQKLAAAVYGALALAERLELSSLALPAISTGIYGFPRRRAAGVILSAIQDFFQAQPGSPLADVRLVLYDRSSAEDFQEAWQAAGLDAD